MGAASLVGSRWADGRGGVLRVVRQRGCVVVVVAERADGTDVPRSEQELHDRQLTGSVYFRRL